MTCTKIHDTVNSEFVRMQSLVVDETTLLASEYSCLYRCYLKAHNIDGIHVHSRLASLRTS